VAERLKATVC